MTAVFDTLRDLVKPDAPLRDRSWLDHRQAEEQQRVEIEHRPLELGDKLREGAPDIPDAQLTYSIEKRRFGVAVRGFQFVAMLPEGYAGTTLELAYLGEKTFLVTCADKPALILEPPGRLRRY